MPELVQSLLDAAIGLRQAKFQMASAPAEPDDIALGCECADPTLQIECWLKEQLAPGDPAGRNW